MPQLLPSPVSFGSLFSTLFIDLTAISLVSPVHIHQAQCPFQGLSGGPGSGHSLVVAQPLKVVALCGCLSLKSRGDLPRLCPTPSPSPTWGASMLQQQLPGWVGFLLLPTAAKLPRSLMSHHSLSSAGRNLGALWTVL